MSVSQLPGEARRLGRNSLWLLAVLFTILLARHMGSAGFGEYAFIATAVFIGNSLTTFGTDMLLIREIAARDDLSRLSAALYIQLILSAVFIAMVWLGGSSLPNQSAGAVLALRVYSLALIPLAFYTIFTAALRGRQLMDLFTLLNLGVSLLQVLAVWVFTRQGGDVVALAWLLLAVQGLAALLAGVLCAVRLAGFWRGWRFSIGDIRTVAVASAPLGWLSLLAMVYQKFSLSLLSLTGGASVAGWFSAAQRAVEAAKTGHLAVFTALYPAMASAGGVAGERKTAWAATLRLSWKMLLVAAALAALGLSVLAAPLVGWVYGPGYEPAVALLRILAWMLVPYTANTFLTLAFVADGREHAVGRALAASLIALVLLSLWWIHVAGPVGVAWAALAAESLQALLLLAQMLDKPIPSMQGEAHELSNLP